MPDESAFSRESAGPVSREEEFVGQELHDTVCQTLQGVSLLVSSLVRAQEKGKSAACEDLKKIRANVDAASEQLRLIFEGPTLARNPAQLVPMLERLAKATSTRVPCSFAADDGATVREGAAAHAFYRVARIFIQIAIRAGAASRITMRLITQKQRPSLILSFEGTPVLSPSFDSSEEKLLEDAMRLGALQWRIEAGTRLECYQR